MFNVAARALLNGRHFTWCKNRPPRAPRPPRPPSTRILCAQEGGHYQPYNDTIHCDRAPAIPFGFHQSRAAVDGRLIGRVNQELMSGGQKRPCWALWESSGQGLFLMLDGARGEMRLVLAADRISNDVPDVWETGRLPFTMLMKSGH